MSFLNWLEQRQNGDDKKDEQKRAEHADLITLPPSVKGTNCSNCKFVKKTKDGAFCEHKEVQLPVTPRMCCKYWDHPDVKRPWGDMEV